MKGGLWESTRDQGSSPTIKRGFLNFFKGRGGSVEGVDVHLDCKRKKKQKPTGKDEKHFWNLTPYFLFQKFKTDRLYDPELIGAGWEVPRNSLGI